MTRGTATEIVGNPYDLHFLISETLVPDQGCSWYVEVNRGHGDCFKPLLSTDKPELLRGSREDALYVIEMEVLLLALASVQIPEGAESIHKMEQAEGREAKKKAMREAIERSDHSPEGCLTLAFVDQIMAVLIVNDECMTFLEELSS